MLKSPRRLKKITVIIVDALVCIVATWLSFSIANDSPSSITTKIVLLSCLSSAIAIPTFNLYGQYKIIFRYNALSSKSIMQPMVVYAVLYNLIVYLITVEGVPRFFWFVQPLLLMCGFLLTRTIAEFILIRKKFVNNSARRKALIYGAGSAGQQIASGLLRGVDIMPVGFIDDDPKFRHSIIDGLPVYTYPEVPELLGSSGGNITEILLAMPSVSRARHKEIISSLSDLPVRVRVLPSISQLAKGAIRVKDFKEIQVEDVLGREPVSANVDLLHQNIQDLSVLVTGAGGSIGSELCRQIIQHRPETLVLYELNEFALYSIERELLALGTDVKIIPILGSVIDGKKLDGVLGKYKVSTVYHAAAYKHVPLIETNVASGVLNNVFGTLRAVESACKAGVKTFVLISTDKAVRPTNVMGCTKRLAELILQAKTLQGMSFGTLRTKLTMVRFGNVLGSSGSVIPVFQEQIKTGGPITVTDPDIIRYFMTIPEAAQLVIQAGAMGHGGDVMLLDMGEPVKINDLAKRMIHLSGLSHRDKENPSGDIEIVYTGLRAGEKLYEELLIGGNCVPTDHERIMRANEKYLTWGELEPILEELEVVATSNDSESIRKVLIRAVPEFTQTHNSAASVQMS